MPFLVRSDALFRGDAPSRQPPAGPSTGLTADGRTICIPEAANCSVCQFATLTLEQANLIGELAFRPNGMFAPDVPVNAWDSETAYHTLGKLDETIAALQKEVRLNPNLPSAKSNLEIELAEKAMSGH